MPSNCHGVPFRKQHMGCLMDKHPLERYENEDEKRLKLSLIPSALEPRVKHILAFTSREYNTYVTTHKTSLACLLNPLEASSQAASFCCGNAGSSAKES